VASQNLADGGCGDSVAQTPQFALDPGVAPRRIVASQPQDQIDEFLTDRRTSRRSGLSPLGRDKPPMPAQHRAGGDQPVCAKVLGQQQDQRREQRAVGPVQTWLWIGPAQHRNLMAQHEQLHVLSRATATQQHQPRGYPTEQKVDQTRGHDHSSSGIEHQLGTYSRR